MGVDRFIECLASIASLLILRKELVFLILLVLGKRMFLGPTKKGDLISQVEGFMSRTAFS